jgi:hypothetical protein
VAVIQEFDSEGNFNVLARLPDESSDAEPALPTNPAFEFDPAAQYVVSAECQLSEESAQLSLELDGEVLLTVEDTEDPITSGTAGLQYSESNLLNILEGFQPFGVVFDNFTLFDLSAGTGEPVEAGDFQSTCTDEAGDLTDDKGNPIDIEPFGIDLAEVTLDAEDGVMTIVWFLNGEAPASSDEAGRDRAIFWSVTINGPDDFTEIRVILEGEEVTAIAANDLAENTRVDLTEHAIISGDSVAVDVPLDEVAIPAEFEWSAFAQLSGFELDQCPSDFDPIAVP